MKSLILASGFGTRLYPLTINQAKALLPYRGKPIIEHIIDKIDADVEILVNINSKFKDDFIRWQATLSRKVRLCIEPADTDQEKLGAIGSLNHWIKKLQIDEDLLVIACDNYFEFELSGFIASYDHNNILIAVCDIGDRGKASEFGVVKLDGNMVKEFKEKPRSPESSMVATAVWLLPPSVFSLISEFSESANTDNLGSFISHILTKEMKVYAFKFSELWIDIGSVETYQGTR